MTQRHKHADLIIAWANGAKIQFRCNPLDEWEDSFYGHPDWNPSHEYRIKPEPKPDVVVYGRLVCPGHGIPSACIAGGFLRSIDESGTAHSNIRASFDGETGALKSVEILK